MKPVVIKSQTGGPARSLPPRPYRSGGGSSSHVTQAAYLKRSRARGTSGTARTPETKGTPRTMGTPGTTGTPGTILCRELKEPGNLWNHGTKRDVQEYENLAGTRGTPETRELMKLEVL